VLARAELREAARRDGRAAIPAVEARRAQRTIISRSGAPLRAPPEIDIEHRGRC